MKSPKKNSCWLIDVSNSFTKVTTFSDGQIGRVRRVPTPSWTPERCAAVFGRSDRPAVLCCVVPKAASILGQHFSQAHFLSATSPLEVGVRYPKPATIGADRLANASAAAHEYGTPAIVVDFGTAVTFDVVSRDGYYEGGVIAPGVQSLTSYLHERTALLPKITLEAPARVIGKSTREAMLAGAVIGYAGLIDAIFGAVLDELGCRTAKLIATGGDAATVIAKLTRPVVTDSLLTLKGLALLAQKIFPKTSSPAR